MIFLLIRRWTCNRHKPVVRIGTTLLVALFLNLFFGLGFYLAESSTQPDLDFGDSVWWSMITMTTVGYGDFYPKTFIGRFLVGYPCLLVGIGLIGYTLSVIAETVLESFNQRKKGLAKMNFENHLVICHCPSTARVIQLVEQFRAAQGDPHRHAVVVSPKLDELPLELREKSIHFVKGLPTSEEVLLRAGVSTAAGVIILASDPNDEGSDSDSFTTGTLVRLIEESGTRSIAVVIELASRKNLRMMERVGADGIVPVEGITDMLLTQEMFNPGLGNLFERLATYKQGAEFYIVPQRCSGRLLREIQIAALNHCSNLQVVGILRNGASFLTPEKSMRLEEKDRLILLAESRRDYETFETAFLTNSQQPQNA